MMACDSCSNKRGESSHENQRVKFVSRRNHNWGNIQHWARVRKRRRAAAIQDTKRLFETHEPREASWSAPALWRSWPDARRKFLTLNNFVHIGGLAAFQHHTAATLQIDDKTLLQVKQSFACLRAVKFMGGVNQPRNSGSLGGGFDLHVFGGIGQFSLIN